MAEYFYSYPETYPIYASRITCAIYAIYCPVIITINVALIVSFFATKQSMQNTSNLLIICLSISDCLIGAVVMPVLIIESLWFDTEKHSSIVRVYFSLNYVFGGISFSMTMLLAIDRYIHMNPNILENESKIGNLFKRPRIYFLIFACCAFFTTTSLSLYFLVKTNPKITAYYAGSMAILLLILMPILVTMYTRGYLRIRRFVAENPVYQNRGEADSNESPEYLEELFKTVLLLIIVTMISYLPNLALNASGAVLTFLNHSYISSTTFLIIAHLAYILVFSNSFLNALIILYRNEKSRKWLKEVLQSCCKRRKIGKEQRSPKVIVNIEIEDHHATSMVESNAHGSTDAN